jgi:hypothetical protein
VASKRFKNQAAKIPPKFMAGSGRTSGDLENGMIQRGTIVKKFNCFDFMRAQFACLCLTHGVVFHGPVFLLISACPAGSTPTSERDRQHLQRAVAIDQIDPLPGDLQTAAVLGA